MVSAPRGSSRSSQWLVPLPTFTALGFRGVLHPWKLGGVAVRLPSGTEESRALGMLAAIFNFFIFCMRA